MTFLIILPSVMAAIIAYLLRQNRRIMRNAIERELELLTQNGHLRTEVGELEEGREDLEECYEQEFLSKNEQIQALKDACDFYHGEMLEMQAVIDFFNHENNMLLEQVHHHEKTCLLSIDKCRDRLAVLG